MRVAVLGICLFYIFRVGAGASTIDCLPDAERHSDKLRETCDSRGCIYKESARNGEPICVLPDHYGYVLKEKLALSNGWAMKLYRDPSLKTLFGNDSEFIILLIEFLSEFALRIRITDKKSRFEVPIETFPPQMSPNAELLYDVEFSNTTLFGFKVVRKSTGREVLDTTNMPGLIFSDQYIQFPVDLAEDGDVYGLGENEQSTLKHDMKWQKWNGWARDSPPAGHSNLYGVFPLLTVVEPEGSAATFVFINSNAQEWVMNPPNRFIYRTTGGILDLNIYLGPTPESSLQQYAKTFGLYSIPPYWSLGHHLCRYGYKNTQHVIDAYERTIENEIPLDAQWIDIDHMHRYLDFTIDFDKFGGLPEFIDLIRNSGKRFVPILDPGIDIENKDANGTYYVYDLGNLLDIWIKRPDGTPVVGKVWPYGKVHFPDFFKETTAQWWKTCIADFNKIIKVDGLWIDMNEPSNFYRGDIEQGCADNSINQPPYIPQDIVEDSLSAKTICPDAVHTIKGNPTLHYNVHSLYGLSESKATISALREISGTRGFVLTRSSFLSSGRWVAKWLGDNTSLWSHLQRSLIGIIQFNMFGIPHVGADICGFLGQTTPELCVRWYQAGAFYPFSRNHNDLASPDQDPGIFESKFSTKIRMALRYRYNLIPTLYTLFYHHYTSGSTVVRAMWNVFPKDKACRNLDQQFMWGSQLLIAPVTIRGATTKDIYFPKNSRWYDISRYLEEGRVTEVKTEDKGHIMTVNAPLDTLPLYFRGGNVFPMQTDDMDTVKSRKNPFEIEIALDDEETAEGTLFYDDGISQNTVEKEEYFEASFSMAKNGVFTANVLKNNYDGMKSLHVKYIGVMGLKCKTVKSVIINGNSTVEDFTFDNGRLQITDLSLSISEGFQVRIDKQY